jgi:hypothetical protein
VWIDEGQPGDNPDDPLFNNGQFDAGVEVGLTNTLVSLYKISDTLNVTDTSTLTGTLVSTMTTDDNGNYRFNGLLPGQYFVQIVVPDGYASSTGGPPGDPNPPYEPAPDPDNDIDNDDNGTATANPLVIRSLPVTLSIGGEPAEGGNYNPTVDFGVYSPRPQASAAIGDFVWYDKVCDGVQDANSVPVPNITVRLYKANGELVGTQLTDAQGKYLFTDLESGQYIVEFVRPAQYVFASIKQGGNINFDSDAAPVATGSLVARTETTELVPDETDLSWDAGLCDAPTDLPPTDEPSLTGPIFLPFVSR